MSDESTRQLKAIMFTDIKGFSAMMGQDEELTVRLVLEHRALIRELLAKHHGQERQTIGDAFMVLFDSAVNAVRCAVEIQTRLREANAPRPKGEQVWIRIGIHLGDIIVEDDDIYGDGVNIAARVEPQAEPGGICITQQVFHQIEGKLDCRVIHIGRRELKNIVHAPELYQIILGQAGELGAASTGSSPLGAELAAVGAKPAAWPRAPWWKQLVWWLVVAPFPLALLLANFSPVGIQLWHETVGDSAALARPFGVLLPLGLLALAHFTSRYWTKGRFNPWLQGRYFVAFPAACLLLFLYHYVVLQSRLETAAMPVRSYTALSPALLSQITANLAEAITRYANSYALDLTIVSYLALTVLLGHAFYPRAAGTPLFRRRDWLVLALGLAFVVAAEVVFANVFAEAGIIRFGVWFAWLLTAMAVLRAARPGGKPFSGGARAFGTGVLLIAAVSSVLSSLGLIMVLSKIGSQFARELLPIVWREGMGEMARGHGLTRLVAVGMLALLAGLLRKGLAWDPADPPGARALDLGAVAVSVLLAVTPLFTFPSATREVERAFALVGVGGMQPVALAPGGSASFYIDRAPSALGLYGQRLYLEVAGKAHWQPYGVDQLLDALAGGRSCEPLIRASLGDPAQTKPASTLCLTAIEARIACEVQGKRLATPEEWDRAVAGRAPAAPDNGEGITRQAIGEWTMRLVHGNPVFEVKGADAAPDIPRELAPNAFSPKVGFRCAYVYEG